MFGSSGKIILGDSEVESMVLSEPKSPKDGKAMTIRQQDDDHNRWNNITQRIDGQSNEARPMGSNHWSLSLSQINIVIGQIAAMESNKVESQPRVAIKNLCTKQAEKEVEVRGPPVSKAFDPTKAIEGFSRRYIVPLDLVLSEDLPATIAKISFPKTMRWNSQCYFFGKDSIQEAKDERGWRSSSAAWILHPSPSSASASSHFGFQLELPNLRYTFQRQSLGLKAKKLEQQKIPWSWLKSKMIFHIYKKIWPMKIGPTSLGSKVHDEAKEATQSSTPTNIEQVHVKKNIDKKRQSMRRQTNRFRPGDFQDLLLMVPRVIGDPV
ncbi:hypothetical protein JHK86_018264 [Glycine max]|nr:hypothetical protein JHK86_018264 [Glycine max]